MINKPNIGPHRGEISNPLSFNSAFELLGNNQDCQYESTGNKSIFTAIPTTAQKGTHKGERVIIFASNGAEMARAYECCWGHQTNCNSTYIDCYTMAILA
jgi:hypothetical protein